jgi:hypothetical protein
LALLVIAAVLLVSVISNGDGNENAGVVHAPPSQGFEEPGKQEDRCLRDQVCGLFSSTAAGREAGAGTRYLLSCERQATKS